MNTPIPSGATWLLRASSLLWLVWGLVHIAAGIFTLSLVGSGETAEAFHGIVSAVELSTLKIDYPAGVEAILSQHAFNLAWFGLVTLLCTPFVWRARSSAIYLAAIVGGLADLAYFIFIDLGAFATFPGPQMTYICAAAIATSLLALYLIKKAGADAVAS